MYTSQQVFVTEGSKAITLTREVGDYIVTY